MTPAVALEPLAWTPILVRGRLVEAFEIEFRLPTGRTGGPGSRSWLFPTFYEFADVVAWADDARAEVWNDWSRTRGALPHEISRMDEALAWLTLLRDHLEEQRCLASWAMLRAKRRPLRLIARRYVGSRAAFYRAVERGSLRIADRLNASGVMVR
jgi:hypothetical protein